MSGIYNDSTSIEDYKSNLYYSSEEQQEYWESIESNLHLKECAIDVRQAHDNARMVHQRTMIINTPKRVRLDKRMNSQSGHIIMHTV